jgi:hypothetical protein
MNKVHPTRELSGMTMTIAELIDELQKHDSNMPVLATWEGVLSGIRPENFGIQEYGGRKQLTIDVEIYG